MDLISGMQSRSFVRVNRFGSEHNYNKLYDLLQSDTDDGLWVVVMGELVIVVVGRIRICSMKSNTIHI